jgi:hypothetical protein
LFPPSRIFFINCTDSLTWRASMRIQGRTQTWAQRLVYHQQSLEPVRFFGKSLHHACMVATRWWALDLLTLSASEKIMQELIHHCGGVTAVAFFCAPHVFSE